MKTNSSLLLSLVALTLPLHAGPRSSANYSIATDTTDAGGKRSTSATYTNDGSAGGLVGVSTVAAPAETAKHGYIGQLYEITGLTLTAATLNVNEGATDQLGASQTLDDATFVAVPAASVTWSVVSGPLTGISAGGLATAAAVFQNTAASVQGSFGGNRGVLGLTVVDTLPDNFGTYANDGLPDAWQVQYFGVNNPNAAPAADPDADGSNNSSEFLSGTVPTSPFSVFTVTTVATATGFQLNFPSVAGHHYSLETSQSMAAGSWTPIAPVLTGTGGILNFTINTTPPADLRRFYRVVPSL